MTSTSPPSREALQPWQFFVLAALGCATAVTFMVRGQGITNVMLLTILMGVAALVGLAALGAVRPLVTVPDESTAMVGERTRTALEREKLLALRAIKELEFDRAMKKLSDEDFNEIGGRLRARAIGLMRQLDAGAGYRERVEQDLAARLAAATPASAPALARGASAGLRENVEDEIGAGRAPITRACKACSIANDADARFCKGCGASL